MNMLPMRVRLDGDLTVEDLVGRVAATTNAGFIHQELPVEKIIASTNPPRETGAPPLYSTTFTLQNVPRLGWGLVDLNVESWNIDGGHTAFDLSLYCMDDGEQIEFRLVYAAESLSQSFAERLVERFRRFVIAATLDPCQLIDDLPLLDVEEAGRLWRQGFGDAATYPRDATVAAVFAQQVASRPDAVAVVTQWGEWTYAEIDRLAFGLAQQLVAQGVDSGDRVGIWLGPSHWRVVGLLAVLRLEAVYVPVEPSEPIQHAVDIWQRAAVAVVICDDTALSIDGFVVVGVGQNALPDLDVAASAPIPITSANPPAAIAAAVHFTSGSMGEPKGVVATHRGILRLVLGADYARFGPEQTLLHIAPLSFDVSDLEIWGALLNGGRLVICDERPPSPASLAALCRRHAVTMAVLTTSLFERIVSIDPNVLASLEQLLVGGEVMPLDAARQFLDAAPRCRLVNLYGPTENATYTTAYAVDATVLAAGTPVAVGRPMANNSAHVRDLRGRLVPPGVEGEICVGGDGLAAGYLGDPALTAQRFVIHHGSENEHQIAYRTGDRGYVDDAGVLHFRGRHDAQVKIRGFRVEPAAAESALRRCGSIGAVAVVARTSRSRPHLDERDHRPVHLVAFVSPAAGSDLDADQLAQATRDFARKHLPTYLRPSAVVSMAALPLGPTGKIDRTALPIPDDIEDRAPLRPATRVELGVAAAVSTVLGTSHPIGPDDDFFALGGDSLAALELVHHLEGRYRRPLPLSRFFACPTVAGIAAVLQAGASSPARALPPTLVELRTGRSGRNLFLVPGGHGGMAEMALYARSLSHLRSDICVFGHLASGLDGRSAVHRSVPEMAAAYLDDIRSVQPAGPYLIAGECVGGSVAWEIGRQLAGDGDPVGLVLLLDSWFPGPGAARYRKLVMTPRLYAAGYFGFGKRLRRDLLVDKRDTSGEPLTRSSLRPSRLSRAIRDLRSVGAPHEGQSASAERNYLNVALADQPRPALTSVTLLLTQSYFEAGIADKWAGLAVGNLDVHVVPGDHDSYLHEATTIHRIDQCLEDAQ